MCSTVSITTCLPRHVFHGVGISRGVRADLAQPPAFMPLAVADPACVAVIVGKIGAGIREPVAAPEPEAARFFLAIWLVVDGRRRRRDVPRGRNVFAQRGGMQDGPRSPRFEAVEAPLEVLRPGAAVTAIKQVFV